MKTVMVLKGPAWWVWLVLERLAREQGDKKITEIRRGGGK